RSQDSPSTTTNGRKQSSCFRPFPRVRIDTCTNRPTTQRPNDPPMPHYAKPLARLLGELEKLPGIGPKSAQRMAFYLLRVPKEEARHLAEAILEVKEKISFCRECYN